MQHGSQTKTMFTSLKGVNRYVRRGAYAAFVKTSVKRRYRHRLNQNLRNLQDAEDFDESMNTGELDVAWAID